MANIVRYLTHPEVRIDPAIPVPQWGLSPRGRDRVRALAAAGSLKQTTRIISSGERKAIETAEPLAAALGVGIEIIEAMHENDRSATGFLPQPEFEVAADQFFARPAESVRGWEKAVDAQARIVREVEAALARDMPGDVLFVGHGAVGTLLYCHHAGLGIDRRHDQRGGGNYFSFTKARRKVLHHWRPMEEMPPA
ncbi:MAG: histidine phosphatase family protein [Hyphomicrobiaceae bacterium]|nr:MAG: histidine phosphatase family protein [Hyphomicrobiaceae bacterium]